jgi:NADH dehydrogenase
MNKDIIGIFGGTGFLGLELVSVLSKSGFQVKVFSRKASEEKSINLMGELGQVTTFSGNINDPKKVESFIEGCDIVINLVALFFEYGSQNFQNIHVDAPIQIAKISKKYKVKQLIHISDRWADENSISKSSKSRGIAEKRIKEIFAETTIVRLDVLFGKNDGLFFRFGKIIKLLPMIPLPKESKAIFNPLFVKDAANAIDKIVKSKTFHGKLFELFGPKSYSWEELMIFFKKNIQSKVFLIKVPITLLSLPALFFSFFPNPLITIDQLRRFKVRVEYDKKNLTIKDLSIKTSSIETEMPKYLKNF